MIPIRDPEKVLSVSGVNQYIKSLIVSDMNLSGIYVSGEISNFKIYNSGHAYFSLKDQGGLLKCVMFSGYVRQLRFMPRDGMRVIAFGNISVYERDGVYQLYAESLLPDGTGSLYAAFEELKKKLEAEGLFDTSRKRPLPLLPSCVGVITSETGAVIRDIKNVIERRFPTMNITHIHVSVQGEKASPEIVRAFDYINSTKCCDVVIVGRGGGSIEDLWAFNEEATVRAVAACKIPVISAVGHETDFTLTDFAADLRAPTPSAAAELAVPVLAEMRERIDGYKRKVSALPTVNCRIKQMELDRLISSACIQKPFERTENEMINIDSYSARIQELTDMNIHRSVENIKALSAHLTALDPKAVLKRGYSIVYNIKGLPVLSAGEIKNGEAIDIQTGNGRFAAVRTD